MSSSLKSQVTSGVFWSGAGRVAQQAIQFALTVVLARLLTPDDYGLMAMVMVFTGFAGMLADAGFNSALIQKQDLAEEHIHTVFWVTAGIGIFLAGLTWLIAPWLAVFFHAPVLTPIFRVIALNFIFSGLSNVPSALLNKRMQFRTLAKMDTASVFLGGAVGVVMAACGMGVWSLVAQTVGGALLSLTFRFWLSRWRPRWIFCPAALKEMLGFSGHLYAFTFMNYWARNADNLVIGKFFGSAVLGAYSRAYGLMLLPITQIHSVVYQVMFPALSGIQDDKERVGRIYLRAVGIVTLLAFPMMLGLSVVAEPFVLAVYGSKWAEVAPILQILAVVGLMQSLVSTTGLLLLSLGRTDALFYWWSSFSILVIGSFFVGAWLGSVWAVALCYAVANLLYSYPALVIGGRVVNLKAGEILAVVAGPFFTSLGMAGVVYGVHFLLPVSWPAWLTLMVLVAVGMVAYASGVLLFRLTAWMDLRQIIRDKTGKKSVPATAH